MTSASELFSTRRSRLSRSHLDLESDPSLNRHHSHHHHHHHHRRQTIHHRHESDGCDPIRRASPRFRRFFLPERRSVRDVEGSVQYLNTNSTDLEIESTSFGNLNGSERLPGAVLLARARLFERLRGVSLSSDSRSNQVLSEDDQRESSFHSADQVSFYGDQNFQLEELQVSYKKPQGLTQGDINCLHRLTFRTAEAKTDIRDCSICLESFSEGDILISLPCNHSFHSCCLNPWLITCGDCPYCRRAIAKES